jgi:holin-like protein
MILECCVLFVFLAIGELIVWLTGIPIPSSIIGMLLLTAALQFKIVKLRWVQRVSDFLVNNLGFFFVPAGVGLMLCLDILADSWLPIVVSVVVSTILIIFVTGHVHQWVRNYLARNNSNKDGISGK